ncbi:Rubredoxin [Burkholderia sp. b14]|nr:Rubredoxin [Burkholderia sp. b14]
MLRITKPIDNANDTIQLDVVDRISASRWRSERRAFLFVTIFHMYKKGAVVEIQFTANRLNDHAGEPYWIDLDPDEAMTLYRQLHARLANATPPAQPLIVSLDAPAARHDSARDAPRQVGPAVRLDTAAAAQPASAESDEVAFRQWVCVICGWVYDEAHGAPDDGIPPGTRWDDVPADWRCPLCDVGKADFAMVEF